VKDMKSTGSRFYGRSGGDNEAGGVGTEDGVPTGGRSGVRPACGGGAREKGK
jgi:hypothetical protein